MSRAVGRQRGALRRAVVVQTRLPPADPESNPLAGDATGGAEIHAGALFIGGSTAMQQLITIARRISETTVSVLIHGETGSGKELMARLIHDCSRRHAQPFCAINCAALPGGLIESTLFGHERGAFTGATQTQVGVFERAHGGSLFLDEVGDLSLRAQAALLRAIETRRICRVGGREELPVDVRLVSATHKNLQRMVKAGTFRADLLFRINTVTLDVPPLRDRSDELPALLVEFIARACEQWHRPVPHVASEVIDALASYAFPGNVRELRNLVERAVAVSDGHSVELADFPEHIQALARRPASGVRSWSGLPLGDGWDPCCSLRERLRAYERDLFLEFLERAEGNHARAAALAGLPLRTFSRRLNQLGVKRRAPRRPPTGATSPGG